MAGRPAAPRVENVSEPSTLVDETLPCGAARADGLIGEQKFSDSLLWNNRVGQTNLPATPVGAGGEATARGEDAALAPVNQKIANPSQVQMLGEFLYREAFADAMQV